MVAISLLNGSAFLGGMDWISYVCGWFTIYHADSGLKFCYFIASNSNRIEIVYISIIIHALCAVWIIPDGIVFF